MPSPIKKIVVVGNIAGGKTILSRILAKRHDLPLTHVDAIQFQPGMVVRPLIETRAVLEEVTARKEWLIDGYGPLDLIEKRFAAADKIVFIDLPIWRHFWWLFKRQIKSIWSRREELPEGCDEVSLAHSKKLIKTLWGMHRKMRPELLKILERPNLKDKVVFVTTLREWNWISTRGLQTEQSAASI